MPYEIKKETPESRISYPFAPVPLDAFTALKEGKVGSTAFVILAFLLGHPRKDGTVWAANSHIARELNLSIGSIARSLRQLKKAGLVTRWHCGIPDPKDKWNRTGWRFRFEFMQEGVKSSRLTLAEETPRYTLTQLHGAWGAGFAMGQSPDQNCNSEAEIQERI